MRKFRIFALILVLTVSLAACRGNDPQASQPTGSTSGATMPSIGSNIPDPTVNDNSTMPEMTDGIDATDDAGDNTDSPDDFGTEGIDPSEDGMIPGEGDTDSTGDSVMGRGRGRLMRKF